MVVDTTSLYQSSSSRVFDTRQRADDLSRYLYPSSKERFLDEQRSLGYLTRQSEKNITTLFKHCRAVQTGIDIVPGVTRTYTPVILSIISL